MRQPQKPRPENDAKGDGHGVQAVKGAELQNFIHEFTVRTAEFSRTKD